MRSVIRSQLWCANAAVTRAAVVRRVLAVAAVGCVVLAGAPAAAVAFQGPWTAPPVALSLTGSSADGPQAAVAPDGTTTVVWRWQRVMGEASVVQASTRAPGGTFGAPVDLSVAGQAAHAPQVAVAPNGTTTAVWLSAGASAAVVQASTRAPGGAFGAPVDLSAAGGDAGPPQVAVAPDGTTTAVWTRSDGSNQIVQAATRPPGGAFGAPVDVSVAGQNAYFPQVALAPDGTTTAVWQRFDGTNAIVQASTRVPGSAFGAPVDLSAPGEDADAPHLALAPDGTTITVWERSNGSSQVVQASTRAPGGAFSAPVDLSAPGADAYGPQVAVGPGGTATAVWGHVSGPGQVVQASSRPPGGTFGAAVDLSVAGRYAGGSHVAVAPDGTTTAVWLRSDGATWGVQASTRVPGAAFGAPVDLSVPGQNASEPQVTVAPDGTATVVWERYTVVASASRRMPTIESLVQAVFTANPPVLLAAPQVSGSALLGATLGCDGGRWIGAAQVMTGWLRGAQQIAAGPAYTTTAADQGAALACRARASNPYGSIDAYSTPLGIPAAPTPPGVPAPPSARSLPRITGTARRGRTLRCRPATFTGATTRTTRWLRAGRPIKGARRTAYKLTRRDVGTIITCRTTATGPGGTSTTISLGIRARR